MNDSKYVFKTSFLEHSNRVLVSVSIIMFRNEGKKAEPEKETCEVENGSGSQLQDLKSSGFGSHP